MVEFAVSLPFFLTLTIGGVELANYASVVMQLNQITLHTADSAARIGSNTPTSNKTISEAQIKDVFEGSLREGDRIALGGSYSYVDPVTGVPSIRGNTRIILSSFEEVSPFNAATPRYRIRWQRCSGTNNIYTSNYGTKATSTSVTGIGPAGRQVTPPPGGAVMLVELQYYFKPLIVNGFTRLTDQTISQVASMVVRENRDLVGPTGSDGIYNAENVTPASCPWG
ncbi:TadE/TadG family type IV pilus assembly protein [Sphingorhabdus sp.]|uniref:TadE/TadG family type IV pilus assembly protein n=1 Tax=Sphingorhabdus sp. TaxID=1902408 RepID=UPI0039832CB7